MLLPTTLHILDMHAAVRYVDEETKVPVAQLVSCAAAAQSNVDGCMYVLYK